MALRGIIISSLLVAIGLLLLRSGVMAPLSLQEETAAAVKWQEDRAPPGLLFSPSQAENLPIEPLVELTVCPEGPPRCQFPKIQEAIDAAPFTPPVVSWSPPPQIPLIRILPGVYQENVVIIKNVWLRGAGKDQVTIRSEDLKPGQMVSTLYALFIAGAAYLGIGIENLTLEGGIKIAGDVTGFIRNNRFLPHPSIGLSGIFLSGQFNLIIAENQVVGGNYYNQGITVIGVSSLGAMGVGRGLNTEPYDFNGSVLIADNELSGITSRPRMNAGPAIAVERSIAVSIVRNRIHQNEGGGIEVDDSWLVGIGWNILERNRQGIAASSSEVAFEGNIIREHEETGVLLRRQGEYHFEDNTIVDNGGAGLVLFSSPHDRASWIVRDNIIMRNNIGIQMNPSAFRVGELLCEDNEILENRLTDFMVGSSPSEELRAHCEGALR